MSEPIPFLDGKVVLHPGDCLDVLRAMPDASIDSVVTDPPYALVSIVKRFGCKNAAPAKEGVYGRSARGFMGKEWDTGERAFAVEFWAEVLRVLKPGGHVLAFSGTRTYHRLACAVEDAGFEIRDQIGWLYGSGFPKSHDVSKGIDKAAGAEREVVATVRKTPSAGSANMNEGWVRPWAEGKTTMDITAPATDEASRWQGWGTALKPAWEPLVVARKALIGTVAANVLAHATGR
jgi:DNA modification methylase